MAAPSNIAGLLAEEFTVVTYHRRGNSLSPRPDGWTRTSVDEQADDLAALIRSLDLAPAVVFGTSAGATILLDLLLRYPAVLRGAIIHEPPLVPVLSNAAEVGSQLQAIVEEGLATRDPRGTMEMFIRINAGDANFENLDPVLRERMLGNAELFLLTEAAAFVSWIPNAADLGNVTVPTLVTAGIDNRDMYYHEASQWVATQMNTTIHELPGAHTPYLDRPVDLAASIRPFLRQVSADGNATIRQGA